MKLFSMLAACALAAPIPPALIKRELSLNNSRVGYSNKAYIEFWNKFTEAREGDQSPQEYRDLILSAKRKESLMQNLLVYLKDADGPDIHTLKENWLNLRAHVLVGEYRMVPKPMHPQIKKSLLESAQILIWDVDTAARDNRPRLYYFSNSKLNDLSNRLANLYLNIQDGWPYVNFFY